MAKYPKINTGNTNPKVDRLNTTNFPALANNENLANNFLRIDLQDSDGNEFVYGVITIESNGTAGSVLDLANITLKSEDAEGDLVDVLSGAATDGNGDPIVTTASIQNDLFVLSPLKRTGDSAWTDYVPFVGTHGASPSYTISNQKTMLPTDVPTDVAADAEGARSFLPVQINASGNITFPNSSGLSDSDVQAYIPLYNHADIIQDGEWNIPQGSYAAILIKCDTRGASIDGTVSYTLNIGHNGINNINQVGDYNLKLQMTGENIFIPGVTFNSSAAADGADLAQRVSLMSKIQDDPWTGYSWPTFSMDSIWNQQNIFITQGTEESAPTISTGDGTFNNSMVQGAVNQLQLNGLWNPSEYIDQMVNINGALFPDDNFIFRDLSSYKSRFNVNITESKDFIDESSFSITELNSVDGENIKIDVSHDSSSFYWENPTTPIDSNSGNYLNFSDSNDSHKLLNEITTTFTHYSKGSEEQVDRVNHQKVLIYPLFTYPQQTLDFYNNVINKVGNYTVTRDTPYADQIFEHAADEIESFEGTSTTSIFTQNVIYSNSPAFNIATQSISYHNVRINSLTNDDTITKNLLNTKHADSTGVAVREASSETALNKDGDVITDTVVPSVGTSKDYTIQLNNDVVSAFSESFVDRSSDGQYVGVDNFYGYAYNTINLKAPVTNWKPAHYDGINYIGERIPYCDPNGPSPKTLPVRHGYYLTRPLLCLAYINDDTAVQQVSSYEFIGPSGYTPDATVATGAYEFSTGNFREDSHELYINNTENIITAKNVVATDPDKASYVAGHEIFNLNETAAFSDVNKRAFIGSFTAGSGSTKTTFTIVDKDNAAINATAGVTSGTGIVLKIGKPVYEVGSRKTNFVHSVADAKGTLAERDRVNSMYGTDLSYEIPSRTPNMINDGDTFIVDTDHADLDAINGGSAIAVKEVATANGSSSSINGSVTVFNFNPVEKGLLNNGNPIPSNRFYNPAVFQDVYGGTVDNMIYQTIGASNFSSPNYRTDFKIRPFNNGDEDIIIKDVQDFDPYYLPAGVFASKPSGSNNPDWAIGATHTQASGSPLTFGGATGVFANDANKTSAGVYDNTVTRLQKADSNLNNGEIAGTTQTEITVNFGVETNSDVAGDYYRAIEITYWRDSSYDQKRFAIDGTVESRPFIDRPVWKTRKLIKISINSQIGITVSDADETAFSVNSTVDFGTISI